MDNNKFKCNQNRINLELQIKHDFYMGTIKGWKSYIITSTIFIFICTIFTIRANEVIKGNNIVNGISLADYILYIFRGMNIFNGSAIELEDKLPQWFLVNIYLSVMVGYFPLKDFSSIGVQVLIRTKSRVKWWLSKCLWIVYTVVLYYSFALIVITTFSFVNGTLSLKACSELNFIMSNLDTSGFGVKEVIIVGIIIPIMTSITISLIQLVISIFTNSVISNMIIVSILILTPFCYHSFIVSNYLMILRSSVSIGCQGTSIIHGFILNILLSSVAIFIGANKISSYDILINE